MLDVVMENSEIRKIVPDTQTTRPASGNTTKDTDLDFECYRGMVSHRWEVVEWCVQNQEYAKHRRSKTEYESAMHRLCTQVRSLMFCRKFDIKEG